jgi:hypothetical protein
MVITGQRSNTIDFTPCWPGGLDFHSPQEAGMTVGHEAMGLIGCYRFHLYTHYATSEKTSSDWILA